MFILRGIIAYFCIIFAFSCGKSPNAPPNDLELTALPVLGNADAKVILIVYGDYQCPFCRNFFKEVEPQIWNEYISIGKVKIVWKDFAFLGGESNWAAEAARCGNDQGKFWQYQKELFDHQIGENQGSFTKGKLKSFARELGLDQKEFNDCLDGGKYARSVKNDTATGRRDGVNGTPYTIITRDDTNFQTIIRGDQPFGIFDAAIKDYLR